MPTLSVYLVCFNDRRLIRDAAISVVRQTRRPDQFVIVDAGSTDGSADVARAFANHHPDWIKTVVLPQPTAMAEAKNIALSHCTGRLLCGMEPRTRFARSKLEREVKLWRTCEDPETVIFSDYSAITAKHNELGLWIGRQKASQGRVLAEVVSRRFPGDRLFASPLVPRELIDQAGPYDPAMKIDEDWELAIRLAERAPMKYCSKVLSQIVMPQRIDHAPPATRLADLEYAIKKHRALIDRLPLEKRAWVSNRLNEQRAEWARAGVEQAVAEGRHTAALKAWATLRRIDPQRADWKTPLKTVLDGFASVSKPRRDDEQRVA